MGDWADPWVAKLLEGDAVQFRPKGHSMVPRIKSNQLVTVMPVNKVISNLEVDDIVLCRVHGKTYLHIIKAIGNDGSYLIGNNRGGINGWTRTIYGKCIKVED